MHLLQLTAYRSGDLSAILAEICCRQVELGAQVKVSSIFVVVEVQKANASEGDVLGCVM